MEVSLTWAASSEPARGGQPSGSRDPRGTRSAGTEREAGVRGQPHKGLKGFAAENTIRVVCIPNLLHYLVLRSL